MDSDTNSPNTNKPWQWLMSSPTRMVGLVLLVLALVLLLALMVLVSQKSPKKKAAISTPQSSPTILPTSIPDPTANWTTLTNTNGYKIKYPPGSQLIPTLPQASSSATLQITSDQSTIAIEVADQKKTLKETVDLIRQKNATSSVSIKINKVITKPISILIGGNEGYEWYLESNGLVGISSTYPSRLGKNRVVEFDKNNKHYLIFSTLEQKGEQLLSTLYLNP